MNPRTAFVWVGALCVWGLGFSQSACAFGRKPGDRDVTLYDNHPVTRGSPANPNSAYSPPRFDSTPGYLPARRTVTPAAVPAAPQPSNAPAPMPSDNAEPPLPEETR